MKFTVICLKQRFIISFLRQQVMFEKKHKIKKWPVVVKKKNLCFKHMTVNFILKDALFYYKIPYFHAKYKKWSKYHKWDNRANGILKRAIPISKYGLPKNVGV